MTEPTKAKLVATIGMVAAGVAALAMVATNPTAIGPLGVTIWFGVLMLALTGLIAGALYWAKGRLDLTYTGQKRFTSSARQAFLVSLAGVMCLALASLSQLGPRDVILVVVFVAIMEFYFRTRS